MDRSDVIYLVSVVNTQDEHGVWQKTTKERRVFCDVRSVSRAEWSDAGRVGLNPEYQITMFFGDYEGEDTLIYNGKAYGVYRTYRAKTDTIELYVEKKGGVNAKENSD